MGLVRIYLKYRGFTDALSDCFSQRVKAVRKRVSQSIADEPPKASDS
jgi:hypothetical protein